LTYSGNTIGYKLTGTNTRDYIFTKTLAIMDGAKDMQFDQTITVNAMPVSDGKIYGPNKSEGCYFILTDEKYNNTRNCKSLFAGLFNSEANGLTLRILVDGVSKNYSYDGWEDIVLNKHVGDTFTLGLRWNADETAVVYVDGKQVGKPIVGATLVTSGLTPNAIQLNYVCTTAGADAETDLSFTDLKLTQHQAYYTSIKEEITAEDLFAGVDLKAVAEDLTLPTTFTSKYLGELPLTWVSDSESVIAVDGTVNRPEGTKGKYVTLSLYVGEQKVFSVYPYVLPETVIVPTSPDVLGAAFSTAEVVVDGATTDEGWSMNTKLQTASGEQLGRLGVQWDTENLYLAVETGGLTPTVKLGETVVDLDGAVTVSNVLEIAVSLSSLGVSVKDYGIEIRTLAAGYDGAFLEDGSDDEVSIGEAHVIYARYKTMENVFEFGDSILCVRVNLDSEAVDLAKTEYLYESLEILKSGKQNGNEWIRVKIPARVYDESGAERTTVDVTLRIVRENGTWRLDSPTYVSTSVYQTAEE